MEGLKQEMINWLNCLATNEALFVHVVPNIVSILTIFNQILFTIPSS